MKMKFALACVAWLICGTATAAQPPTAGGIEPSGEDANYTWRLEGARERGNHLVPPDIAWGTVARIRQLLGMPSLKGLPPQLRQMKTKGTNSLPIFLVEVGPHQHTNEVATMSARLFGAGYPAEYPYESLRNYYLRSSYGQLDLRGTVYDWYTNQHDRAYYAANFTLTNWDGVRLACSNVLQALIVHYTNTVDFSLFDNDTNGYVDCVVVVWSGPANSGPANKLWWPFRWQLSTPLPAGKVQVQNFIWISEQGVPQYPVASFGRVMCHETGHALGLPDYYDTDSTSGPPGGVGGLDMMDDDRGDHNTFSKFMLDWITPKVVGTGHSNFVLGASAQYSSTLAMMPGYSGTTTNEIFMVENRYRVLNDVSNMADGVLIWHVDATLDTNGWDFKYNNSTTDHKLLRLMEADGWEQIGTNGPADPRDYFTYPDRKLFTDQTAPRSTNYSGVSTYVSVGVLASNAPMLEVCGSIGGTPPIVLEPPQGQSAEAGTNVTFTLLTTNNVVPVSYQWSFSHEGGFETMQPMVGRTATNLALLDVQEPDEGLYAVVSSNCLGSLTNTVGLSVNDTSPPVFQCTDPNGYCTYLYAELNESCAFEVPDVLPYVTNVPNAVSDNSHFFVLQQDPPAGFCTNCFPGTAYMPGERVFPWAVRVTASDAMGNRAEGWVWVGLLYYSYAPRLIGPTNITLAADANCQARLPALHDPQWGVLVSVQTCFNDSELQWSQVPEEGAMLGLGNSIVQLTCRDPAGHEVTWPITMTVVDLLPPSITCPSNRLVTIPGTENGAVVEFSDTRTADNCPGVVGVICDPPSGSRFPPGTNRVVCTAVDAQGNSNTCSFTITVNRAPITATDSLRAVQNLPATVQTSELLANDRDPDGDPLSVTQVSPDSAEGGTLELTNNAITYQPPPDFVGEDGFTCTVSDGRGGSALAAVAVTVLDEHDPLLYRLRISRLTPAEVVLVFQGVPGCVCRLQRSSDLEDWEEVQAGLVPGNGVVELRDSNPVPDEAFYRVARQ